MARYISLIKSTREGAVTIKEISQRYARQMEYTQQLGVKIIDVYATLGPYDYVAILEGPDDLATAFKLSAFTSSFGAVSPTTLPALPIQDFLKAVEEIPSP